MDVSFQVTKITELELLKQTVQGLSSDMIAINIKDLNSTEAKRGSVFIGVMTPDGAIWFISKGGLNEVIIRSLQEVIKRPLKVNIPVI